jgi:hypothetical protein
MTALINTETKTVERKGKYGGVRSITTKQKAPKARKVKKIKATRVLKAKPKKVAKVAVPKKPGVIDAIVEVLRTEGGISLADLSTKIAKKFPDRNADGLAKTCRVQLQRLPLPKEDGGRGIKVKRVKQEGTNAKLYLI